jgi:hypothetical protein
MHTGPRYPIARARLSLLVPLLAACTLLNPTGGIPRQPFEDIPVPATFTPFSDEWAVIRTNTVTAARLVYMTPQPLETIVEEMRALLTGAGWNLRGSETIGRAGFTGRALSFEKRGDTCRAEILPTTNLTRVDLIVGRTVQ